MGNNYKSGQCSQRVHSDTSVSEAPVSISIFVDLPLIIISTWYGFSLDDDVITYKVQSSLESSLRHDAQASFQQVYFYV